VGARRDHHLIGIVFSVLLVLSVSALSFYLYRRHGRVENP
jgi:hypothetical protein